jgi:hypothetical protein
MTRERRDRKKTYIAHFPNSRRARKRARLARLVGHVRHFGFVENGKFYRTLTLRPGDNLTDELVHNAVK